MNKTDTITLPYRVGVVGIQRDKASIQLNFFYEGQRHRVGITRKLGLKPDNQKDLHIAVDLVTEISNDIKRRTFDTSLRKYGLGEVEKKSTGKKTRQWDLKECFEQYKTDKRATGVNSHSTQQTHWKICDNILDYVGSPNWDLEKPYQFLAKAQEKYALNTLIYRLNILSAAINHCIENHELEIKNPLKKPIKDLKKVVERQQDDDESKWFSERDVNNIITAFSSDWYSSPKSATKHSYYTNFVIWQFLTGCRPCETIALTWDDVPNFEKVAITKGFTYGKLGNTKTYKPRYFNTNNAQKKLLEYQRQCVDSHLVFPSPDGGYINISNFTTKVWRPVVEKLVRDEYVDEYLPFYSLRHTFATYQLRAGMDVKRVSDLLGDRVDTVIEHYLGDDKTVQAKDLNITTSYWENDNE